MVKITGIMLLLFMSAMTGFFATDSLRRRLCGLKALRNMLESLRLMVRYEALEVTEMVRRLCEGEISSEISFISALNELIQSEVETGNMTFSEAWSMAVNENGGAFTEDDKALICRVGNVLGSCSCDGQLSALSLACEETDRLIIDAGEQYKAKGRLYRALGAIAGAVIAVIIV